MGQKATGRASDFNQRVVDEIERRRGEVQMTKADLIRESKVPSNTFHTKMRGEKPFNLNEIEKLAVAMRSDPMIILKAASGGIVGAGAETPKPSGDSDVRDEITDRRERRRASSPQKKAALDRSPSDQPSRPHE